MMRYLKPAVFILCLWPLASLLLAGFTDGLGAEPVSFVYRDLGLWALRFLCITLAITPVRKISGFGWLVPLRRMLGLYAFFYALLHLLVFWGADLMFSPFALWREVVKRPYITVGMAAFVILILLAATSTNGMIRRLGGPRWRALHKLVYAAAILAVLHFWWLKASKHDLGEPLMYAIIVGLLLGYRLLDYSGHAPRLKRKRQRA